MAAATTVDAYLAALPPATRAVLQKVRAIVKAAAPDLDEAIAYQMPAWRFAGRPVVYAAGWQQHWSLYPAGRHVAAVFGDELAPFHVSKGTIRFTLDELPADLVSRIVVHRAAEARAEAAERLTKKKPKAATSTTKKASTRTSKASTRTLKASTRTSQAPAKKAPAKKAPAKKAPATKAR